MGKQQVATTTKKTTTTTATKAAASSVKKPRSTKAAKYEFKEDHQSSSSRRRDNDRSRSRSRSRSSHRSHSSSSRHGARRRSRSSGSEKSEDRPSSINSHERNRGGEEKSRSKKASGKTVSSSSSSSKKTKAVVVPAKKRSGAASRISPRRSRSRSPPPKSRSRSRSTSSSMSISSSSSTSHHSNDDNEKGKKSKKPVVNKQSLTKATKKSTSTTTKKFSSSSRKHSRSPSHTRSSRSRSRSAEKERRRPTTSDKVASSSKSKATTTKVAKSQHASTTTSNKHRHSSSNTNGSSESNRRATSDKKRKSRHDRESEDEDVASDDEGDEGSVGKFSNDDNNNNNQDDQIPSTLTEKDQFDLIAVCMEDRALGETMQVQQKKASSSSEKASSAQNLTIVPLPEHKHYAGVVHAMLKDGNAKFSAESSSSSSSSTQSNVQPFNLSVSSQLKWILSAMIHNLVQGTIAAINEQMKLNKRSSLNQDYVQFVCQNDMRHHANGREIMTRTLNQFNASKACQARNKALKQAFQHLLMACALGSNTYDQETWTKLTRVAAEKEYTTKVSKLASVVTMSPEDVKKYVSERIRTDQANGNFVQPLLSCKLLCEALCQHKDPRFKEVLAPLIVEGKFFAKSAQDILKLLIDAGVFKNDSAISIPSDFYLIPIISGINFPDANVSMPQVEYIFNCIQSECKEATKPQLYHAIYKQCAQQFRKTLFNSLSSVEPNNNADNQSSPLMQPPLSMSELLEAASTTPVATPDQALAAATTTNVACNGNDDSDDDNSDDDEHVNVDASGDSLVKPSSAKGGVSAPVKKATKDVKVLSHYLAIYVHNIVVPLVEKIVSYAGRSSDSVMAYVTQNSFLTTPSNTAPSTTKARGGDAAPSNEEGVVVTSSSVVAEAGSSSNDVTMSGDEDVIVNTVDGTTTTIPSSSEEDEKNGVTTTTSSSKPKGPSIHLEITHLFVELSRGHNNIFFHMHVDGNMLKEWIYVTSSKKLKDTFKQLFELDVGLIEHKYHVAKTSTDATKPAPKRRRKNDGLALAQAAPVTPIEMVATTSTTTDEEVDVSALHSGLHHD